MATITTRAAKGSALTHAEVDGNFTNLNTDKLDTAGIAAGSAASPTIKFTGDTNTGLYSPGADQVAISTGGTGRLFVDSSGRVGIGTSSPTGINGAGYNSLLTINSSANTAIDIKDVNGNWFIGTTSGSLVAYSQTATAERLRIDSSGRLLVGTSAARSTFYGSTVTPRFQLEATSQQASSVSLTNSAAANDGGSLLVFGKQRSGSIGGNTIVNSGDELGQISFQGSDGSKHVIAAVIQAFVDGTPSTNDMPGRLVFSTTADGASNPTEVFRVTSDDYLRMAASTGGIQFNGDTAAANALDDYEEGTWTPNDGSGAGLVFTSVFGWYTKLGRSVMCQATLTYPSTTNGSAARIGGLPFSGSNGGGFSMYVTGTTGSLVFRSSSASAVFIVTSGTDQDVAILNSGLSLATIQLTFFYQIGT